MTRVQSVTVGMVIQQYVRFRTSMGGTGSALASQLEALQNTVDGFFSVRDDGDKSRGTWSAENAIIAKIDMLPFWKDWSPVQGDIVFALNTPRRWISWVDRVPLWRTCTATGEVVQNSLPEDEFVIGPSRDKDGAMDGWNVSRTDMQSWQVHEVAECMGLSVGTVNALNRSAYKKTRDKLLAPTCEPLVALELRRAGHGFRAIADRLGGSELRAVKLVAEGYRLLAEAQL